MNPLTFFVLGIGHAPTDKHFSINPFAQNTRMMCAVLKKNGHKVFHCGVEGSTAECDEHINLVMKSEIEDAYGKDYHELRRDLNTVDQTYTTGLYNVRGFHEIKKRAQPGDFLLVMGGRLHQDLVGQLDELKLNVVEPACGYTNVFTRHRVFPSHAAKNCMYAQFDSNWRALVARTPEAERKSLEYLTTANPLAFQKPCDGVVPHGCFIEDFEIAESPDDYILQVSRIIPSKGIEMAVKVSEALGKRLVIAGHGDFERNLGFKPPKHVELIGPINFDERRKWMSRAYCLMAWSIYPEFFGYTAVESMLGGRQSVTSNQGAYAETIPEAFRTESFKETCEAVERVKDLNPQEVRQYAIDRFSIDAVAPQYEKYFRRLHAHLKGLETEGEGFYHSL